MNKNKPFDVLVIGAGIGGLSSAAILVKNNLKTLVLEAHSVSGGCASFFDKYSTNSNGVSEKFRFDVGATTISAVKNNQPLGILFKMLDISLPLSKIDPGLVCHLKNGINIIRYSQKEKWINECIIKFGEVGQFKFWEKVYELNDLAWNLAIENPSFPPKSLKDILRMVRFNNLKNLNLLKYLNSSVADFMHSCGNYDNLSFRDFIDEQLKITSQNSSEKTPMLVGSMGLAYPSETYYPLGGMYSLSNCIENKFKELGGIIKFKTKVVSIEKEENMWRITTKKNEVYYSKIVLSNSTIYDMTKILKNNNYFENEIQKHEEPLSAFVCYFVVENTFDDLGTLYHQIHASEIPFCGSNSIFLSLSAIDDEIKAPKGWRVATVSTHTSVTDWLKLARSEKNSHEKNEYYSRKNYLEKFILKSIENVLPGFSNANKKLIKSGTPNSFEFFTNRKNGYVGGIAHDIKNNILFATKHRTNRKNLFMIGDTVYPGQGTPAVVMCAINAVYEILQSNLL